MAVGSFSREFNVVPGVRLSACGCGIKGNTENQDVADLVLFDPDTPYILDRFGLNSKSKNTPFDGQRLQGVVLATFVAGQKVYGR